MKNTFLVFILSIISSTVFATYGIEEKIMLEKSMSSTIEEVIHKMTGSKNLMVIVNIEHNPQIAQETIPSKSTPQTIRGDVGSTVFPGMGTRESEKKSFLPGVPLARENYPLPTMAQPTSSVSITRVPSDFIKRIAVTIVLDEIVQDDVIAKIKQRLQELFPINFARGDSIKIKKMPFKRDVRENFLFWKNIAVTQLPWLVGLIILAIFLFGPVRIFLRNMISTMEVFRIQADTRILAQAQTFGVPNSPQGLQGGADKAMLGTDGKHLGSKEVLQLPAHIGKHFQFVTADNISNLVHLLKEESPETSTLVLTYLPLDMVNRVLAEFDADYKTKVLKEMMKKKQYTRDEVEATESRLKQKVDYLLGGIENTISLLNTLDEETRQKILGDLQLENPQLAAKVISTIVPFETFFMLPQNIMQEMVRISGTHLIAAVVKVLSTEEQVNYILSCVSENAKEMIKQELTGTSISIPQSRLSQIKQQIIASIQDMQKKGMIKINREGIKIIGVESMVAHGQEKV